MNSSQQNAEEDKRFSQLCYSVLNNPDGKELLKFLHQKFLIAPVADPDRSVNYAYYREGQNDLVRKLRAAITIHSINMRGNNDGTSN